MKQFVSTLSYSTFALFAGANVAFSAGGHDAHHGAHGEGASAGLPQMDPTWFASQIFWLAVMFVVLYVVFSKSILPALGGTIEARRERIQNDLDNARNMKDEAERVHQEYDKLMSESREKSSALFAKAQEDIKTKTNKHIDELRERTVSETQATEKRLAKSTKNAMADMDSIAAEIASLAAEKIIGVSTDIKKAKSVVDTINKKAA